MVRVDSNAVHGKSIDGHGKHLDSIVAAAADENFMSTGYIKVLMAVGRMRNGALLKQDQTISTARKSRVFRLVQFRY
jgi:hypothetical protein